MRGIIFSATGERYVSAALKAAAQSLQLNPVPHAVFCSCPAEAAGIRTIAFESCANPHIDKISNMAVSPYDETIYLDVDCIAVERFMELFDLLENYDLAAAHAPGYRGAPDPEVPVSFYEINTGVLVYRLSAQVRAMLQEWRSTYEAWLADPPFDGADGRFLGQDQPAFRRCLWRSKIPLYVLAPEYNWRFLVPSFLCGKVKIIHGFVTDADVVAAKINESPLRARVYPALATGYGISSEIDGTRIIDALNSPG